MPEGREHVTFCRICEAHCGLVVDVEDGESIGAVRPDRNHPVSQGYVCVKGTSAGRVHHDPTRLNHPQKRVGDDFVPISWAQALSEIGERVRALRATHGPRSVAMYTGNPTFFNAGATLWSGAFLESLGSPNLFASHSVDVNNKFHVATEMYGLSMVHPVPDLDHCKLFICLGSNPAVSQMSVVQVPHVRRRLTAIEKRGGRVIVVDPRRTETAATVGEHVAIRPGTDAVLLLGMLATLVADGLDDERFEQVADGTKAFLDAAEGWSAARAAAITGVSEEKIEDLARSLRDADGGALYMSTGINMGPFGSICAWLVQGLNLVTGQLDRRGGMLVPKGAYPALQLARWLGLGGFDAHRTLVNGWHRVAGAFPVGALAEEIEADHPERIRALFVCAGNPVRSVPGRLPAALDKLDLLVGIDLYRNDTTARADYLLPATDMLERSDFSLAHTLLQLDPHAQYTSAAVAPKAERRPEWRIFRDMARACGASPLGLTLCGLPGRLGLTLDGVLAGLLRWGGQTTLGKLRAAPRGVDLPATEPGSFLGKRVPRGRVNLAPASVLADLPRLQTWVEDRENGRGLQLIGRRRRTHHNSWLPRGRAEGPLALLIHPDDAAVRGITEGCLVRLRIREAELEAVAKLTADMMLGVVSLPHGAPEPYDVNRLIPLELEPVSGQAVLLGHAVEVELGRANRRG